MYFEPRAELAWQQQGLCVGNDPTKWDTSNLNPLFPDKEAAQLCRGCPVINQCRIYARSTFSNSEYAGTPWEEDSGLVTTGVVMGGQVW